MSLLPAALLALVATGLSVGWTYAMAFIPLFQVSLPRLILLGVLGALLIILVIIIWRSRSKGFAIFSFLLLWPLLTGTSEFISSAASYFSMLWWQNALAIGGALLLFLIYAVILNAIDVEEHPVTMWIAFVFFFGLTVGATYLLRIVSLPFADIFSQCSSSCLITINISIYLVSK